MRETIPDNPMRTLSGPASLAIPRRTEGRLDATENKLKVLIVDDSPVSRKLVESALSHKPYALIFAATGRQAVELFKEHRPALVILNWTMPDLAGEDLCHRIRSNSEYPYTYIMVLTNSADKQSPVKALEAGADSCLTKPFHRRELIVRVGAGIRLVELYRRLETKNALLEELALTDALTGLPNRRAVEDWGFRQLSSAARHGFSFWLVVADLDHFKQVNDTFGHQAGDAVLKNFSRILSTQLRRDDFCGRIGGEEFLIVLTHATRENAVAVIERIRLELQSASVSFGGCTVAVTASFGLAGFAENQIPAGFSELQSLADAALYSAKQRGRNRVEIAAAAAF